MVGEDETPFFDGRRMAGSILGGYVEILGRAAIGTVD